MSSDEASSEYDSETERALSAVSAAAQPQPRGGGGKGKQAGKGSTMGFIHQTSFDVYFLQASRASRTSANVFSDIIPPLSREEYAAAIAPVKERELANANAKSNAGVLLNLDAVHIRPSFNQYARELEEGFNLLFYGFGSKRDALNAFARETCAKRGHVVVVNAYRPDFVLRDMLAVTENVPGLIDEPQPTAGSGVEGQTQRLCRFFSAPEHERRGSNNTRRRRRPLFMIIHNIDAAALRTPKAIACLSTLASCPNIHISASVDHINAPLLFPLSQSLTRKQNPPTTNHHVEDDSSEPTSGRTTGHGQAQAQSQAPPQAQGFAWLWHDLTTLAPYDVELAFADPGSIAGASAISKRAAEAALGLGADNTGIGGATAAGAHMTETAAQHILASVTQRAKKLFVLVAQKQVDAMDATAVADDATSAPASAPTPNITRDFHRFGIPYDTLFVLARDQFVATSDGALRALLGEFRDHGLIVSTTSEDTGGKESLHIPLRKERLVKVLQVLDESGR
jgi:origin recognition complex subunit 2